MGELAELRRSPQELQALLATNVSPQELISELIDAVCVRDPAPLHDRPAVHMLAREAAPYLAQMGEIPLTTHSLYREFQRTGERRGYERIYYDKRTLLAVAALQVLLGNDGYIDPLHDLIWSVCEETNWVLPAHEQLAVDLFAAGTAFDLAEIDTALGPRLADEVRARMEAEIERRVLAPYLEQHEAFWWYRGHSNWNGVCNGAIGATFLLLERDDARLARAMAYVLEGVAVYLETAFAADGGSNEGVGYWQYGLSNVVPLAEMLRRRTAGQIDILATERVRTIARYPPAMMLSVGHYANFSDAQEDTAFAPGLVTRLAERTGVEELRSVLVAGAPMSILFRRPLRPWGFGMPWRNILWWDGERPASVEIGDSCLPDLGVARLVAATPDGVPVVLAAKAGHNGENHNHNDVGSLILHVDGETFLCDPARGLYSRDYFGPRRYENVFANSYGHSVPRVAGQLQPAGESFRGSIVAYEPGGDEKRVELSIGGAYAVPGLGVQRSLRLVAAGEAAGELVVEDTFTFEGWGEPVEEAFVTWLEVTVEGATARLAGTRHTLLLAIEEPAGSTFRLEVLEKASAANAKPVPLKRLSFTVALAARATARVRARVED